jgi:hypothetical protein
MNVVSYLIPTDVSFQKISVGEGECKSIATGSMFPSNHNVLHPRWIADLSKGDIKKGCRVEGPNYWRNPPYDFVGSYTEIVGAKAGTFTWNIPCEYHASRARNLKFFTLIQKSTFDGKGGIKISKAGNSVQNP